MKLAKLNKVLFLSIRKDIFGKRVMLILRPCFPVFLTFPSRSIGRRYHLKLGQISFLVKMFHIIIYFYFLFSNWFPFFEDISMSSSSRGYLYWKDN